MPSVISNRHPGNSGHYWKNDLYARCTTSGTCGAASPGSCPAPRLPAQQSPGKPNLRGFAEDFLRKAKDIGKSAVLENPKEAMPGQFVFCQGGAGKAAKESRDLARITKSIAIFIPH